MQNEQRLPYPPPKFTPLAGGSVAEYLLARPGWKNRILVARMLGLTDRLVRKQAEHSRGKIIFASEQGKGLCHVFHASPAEIRGCVAELRARAISQLRRADEIMEAAQTGGA